MCLHRHYHISCQTTRTTNRNQNAKIFFCIYVCLEIRVNVLGTSAVIFEDLKSAVYTYKCMRFIITIGSSLQQNHVWTLLL